MEEYSLTITLSKHYKINWEKNLHAYHGHFLISILAKTINLLHTNHFIIMTSFQACQETFSFWSGHYVSFIDNSLLYWTKPSKKSGVRWCSQCINCVLFHYRFIFICVYMCVCVNFCLPAEARKDVSCPHYRWLRVT